MDIRQLESLLEVIHSPTMTRAAENLRLSPAAVSRQIQALASELGVDLFVKSGRKLTPTPAALRLAEQAKAVMVRFQYLKKDFANDAARDSRPFHFASGTTTLIYRLASPALGHPINKLRKELPNLDLHVSVLTTEGIVAGLLDRQFDLGLISLPVKTNNLRIVPLFDEELLVIRPSPKQVHGNHIGMIRPSQLENVPFLLYTKGTNMRQVIDRFLESLGLKPRVIMEASDTEAIKHLVESGLGYSILPEHALRRSTKYFQTLRVAGHRLIRRQAFAMPLTSRPRALTEYVAMFLKKALDNSR
jgi:DNA-binding transcriptional LysR family regulator